MYGNATHFLIGLVGRAKKNHLKEVGCTSSHLEAMRQAIYENRSSSRYAVIMEDDIFMPFNIDFEELARSAPKDFGILQIFNSNEESMESSWNIFKRSAHKYLWIEKHYRQMAAFWSTCAYLIDRHVMKPVIDKIAYKTRDSSEVHLKIVAGILKPCRPKLTECCEPVKKTYAYNFIQEAPCIAAPRGFQADSFIYALNKTYVLTVPLITNGVGGNQSTFHQEHVEMLHKTAFAKQRHYVNRLIRRETPLPTFASVACKRLLDVDMKLIPNFTDSGS